MTDLVFTVVCTACQLRSPEMTLHDANGDVRPKQDAMIERLGWLHVLAITERDVHLCPECTAAIHSTIRIKLHV